MIWDMFSQGYVSNRTIRDSPTTWMQKVGPLHQSISGMRTKAIGVADDTNGLKNAKLGLDNEKFYRTHKEVKIVYLNYFSSFILCCVCKINQSYFNSDCLLLS